MVSVKKERMTAQMAKRIRNRQEFWRGIEKERSHRNEERKAWRDWMEDKISTFDESDRIWMTLSFGKFYSQHGAN